jgi:hypothetical protein
VSKKEPLILRLFFVCCTRSVRHLSNQAIIKSIADRSRLARRVRREIIDGALGSIGQSARAKTQGQWRKRRRRRRGMGVGLLMKIQLPFRPRRPAWDSSAKANGSYVIIKRAAGRVPAITHDAQTSWEQCITWFHKNYNPHVVNSIHLFVYVARRGAPFLIWWCVHHHRGL